MRRVTIVLSTLALAGAALVWTAPPAAATVTIQSCDDQVLRRAVAKAAIIRFGVDCPALVLNREIVIPADRQVTISGTGHTVALDGDGLRRHFTGVSGAAGTATFPEHN
jgi:hypothetical protein